VLQTVVSLPREHDMFHSVGMLDAGITAHTVPAPSRSKSALYSGLLVVAT
jgi:hypothetical protein